MKIAFTLVLSGLLLAAIAVPAEEIPQGVAGYTSQVVPFLKTHCVACHGPDKSKGKITVDTLDGELSAGHELERWGKILKMLETGEMPPEDEKQPSNAERKAVIAWIHSSFRSYAKLAGPMVAVPLARRLTNFEYQNTMRDLLGFELKLIKSLPEDPVKPYRFNNTAEFMLIGPEQMDRYLECARQAMASVIVDPSKPEVHRTQKQWKFEASPTAMSAAEIGVYGGGGGRFGVSKGMGLKSWPKTGEFRIRVKASAILPPGTDSVPMRLLMGYDLNENQSTFQVEPIGTLRLTNSPEKSQVFEFRGHIENFPIRPSRGVKVKVIPPTITITPQNLYDNGELNDHHTDKLWPLTAPRAVVESIEFEAPFAEVWPPEYHSRILFESPLRKTDKSGYVREVLSRFMNRAYRRPVAIDELDRFVKIYNLLAADFQTMEEAMRETLAMVLISPQFLYHTVAEDRAKMRQYELASNLSYFLWGSMPDDVLFALAAQGRLDDPSVIEVQVRRMLADKRSDDFVNNFTTQWLSITKMQTVSVNKELFPRFLYLVPAGERKGTEEPYRPTIRDYMQDETVGFIAELIKRNASVLQIVDSDFAFLNQPLAAHYGVPGVQGNEFRPVAIKPEHHLGGLLTQGSILVGNSTGSAPHPIYRAVWLREAILGEEVRPPPAEVPALSDSAGDAAAKAITIKDLLRQHRKQESCNVCHASLDPWGIPFEKYNAVGMFQPVVPKGGTKVRGFVEKLDKDLEGYAAYLKSINTVEVHAESRLPHGPVVDGIEELKAYLLKQRRDDIARNVIQRLLSYGIGRSLTYRDQSATEELLNQGKKNEYRLVDLIVSICQSETFRGLAKH